jgi:hypothetical protein
MNQLHAPVFDDMVRLLCFLNTSGRHMNLSDAIRKIPVTALWLGLAGLLPFWLPLASLTSAINWLPPERALLVQMGYGAVILSFLGGVRWGAALKLPRGPLQSTLFVLSVLPSLVAFATLILPTTAGLILLIAGFLLQGIWDVQSAQGRQLPQWFAPLRAILTTGAVLALLLSVTARLTMT